MAAKIAVTLEERSARRSAVRDEHYEQMAEHYYSRRSGNNVDLQNRAYTREVWRGEEAVVAAITERQQASAAQRDVAANAVLQLSAEAI